MSKLASPQPVSEWHIDGKDYVAYGGGVLAEVSCIDLRVPAIIKLRQWINEGRESGKTKKELASQIRMPQWFINGILNGTLMSPTATLYEIIEELQV